MKSKLTLILISLLLAAGTAAAAAIAEPLHHDLKVELDPTTHKLWVADRIKLPGGPSEFLLNADLEIIESNLPMQKMPLGDVAPFFGINSAPLEQEELAHLARYRVEAPPEGASFALTYEGTLDYGLSDQKEEYTRGFRETNGIIGEEGVYLAGNGYWYPRFNDDLVRFTLELSLPEGWHVISQGAGSSRDEQGRARWDSKELVDEIYITGGPLIVYRDSVRDVETLVYLRQQDKALAGKYLEATAQYMEMFHNLIGPYPYTKFALVENFWETGYGMPSFTLLGPTVIRFPFIIHSSYPHEILHNWWGNSVFVDYEKGNWCEGLTAYMADHLIQEQRGKGAEYRRGTLQKYRNYVQEGEDFPLSEFRSRHSGATEAVGYGKALMGFHMLRNHLGADKFMQCLTNFYDGYKGQKASFGDLQVVCERSAKTDLEWLFQPWVYEPGAASLGVEVESVVEDAGQYVVNASILQKQAGDTQRLEVPVVLQHGSGTQTARIKTTGSKTSFSLNTDQPPLGIHVDPYFDLFRLLDPREIPASIGQIFGEEKILALLPGAATKEGTKAWREKTEAWKALLESWQSDSHRIEIEFDSAVKRLPEDRSIWLLGRQNMHAGWILGEKTIELGGRTLPFEDHSIVRVERHPENIDKAIGWLAIDPVEAFAGIGRKLPHYGKYSYLAFEGDEPTNIVKGQWPTTGSPLVIDLRPKEEQATALPPLPAGPHRALAELPVVFSRQAMEDHVSYLSSPELAGRGLGSEGADKAAAYIAKKFEAAGLLPGGDDDTFYQRFVVEKGPDGKPHKIANVIGYLPGAIADWQGQSVVLGAHYDHLGLGWPDVHSGDEGKVHPGADDNASGVAVMLELAKNFADQGDPPRTLVFVAFVGEEAGRLGSKHFVTAPGKFPADGIRSMVNLDTVGRLFDKPLMILGTGTAAEWSHIFRGCSYVTGLPSRDVNEPLDSSDQESFIEVGIPAVQLFSGPHADYHRPTDSADKVDGSGLVKVATFLKEAIVYLVTRKEPLEVKIEAKPDQEAGEAAAPAHPGGMSTGRRVSFGSIPDFAYSGPGIQLSGVMPGSPAEAAGLQEGDILLSIDDQEIAGLKQFSELLKSLKPGQTVKAAVQRGEETMEVEVTVVER